LIRVKVETSQPALRVDFGQVIGDMLGDLMSSVSPIEVKVLETTKKLQKIAKQVAQIVEKTEGTADVFDGIVSAGPSISVTQSTTNYHNMGLLQLICNFNCKRYWKECYWFYFRIR
jgi:Cu/Ag efflux pump CusA